MSFITRWRERRERQHFVDGFNYAAGELLRGAEPEAVEQTADVLFNPTQFDAGITAALVAWQNLLADEPSAST